MTKKIALIVGSLRKESINRKLAKQLIKLAPANLESEIVEIADLPLYNEDSEANTPPAWKAFREKMQTFDGVIFVTPEYNRSVPAPLKNAIDVGSRPYGSSIWDKKPAAVVSSSPSPMGGFGANQQVRQALVCLNMPCLQMPETYIGNAANLFDANGELTNESTKDFLKKFLETYSKWVTTNAK